MSRRLTLSKSRPLSPFKTYRMVPNKSNMTCVTSGGGPTFRSSRTQNRSPAPPREILQGGTILLWSPGDRLRLPSKLNNLEIVENTPPKKWKNQNKTSIAKAMGPLEIHRFLLLFPDPGPMYRLNPLSYALTVSIGISVAQSSVFCVVFVDYSYYHWIDVTDGGHFVH